MNKKKNASMRAEEEINSNDEQKPLKYQMHIAHIQKEKATTGRCFVCVLCIYEYSIHFERSANI